MKPAASSTSTWPSGGAPACPTVPAGLAPLYALEPEALAQRCREDIAFTMDRLHQSSSRRPDFNLEPSEREKVEALEAFLADRQAHPESYIPGALPELPLADGGLHEVDCFDLAWHHRALAELLRVCRRELRIFPAHTITLPTRVHPYVAPLIAELPAGWQASLEPTSYDQGASGETPMLRIRRVGPSPTQTESDRPLPAQE